MKKIFLYSALILSLITITACGRKINNTENKENTIKIENNNLTNNTGNKNQTENLTRTNKISTGNSYNKTVSSKYNYKILSGYNFSGSKEVLRYIGTNGNYIFSMLNTGAVNTSNIDLYSKYNNFLILMAVLYNKFTNGSINKELYKKKFTETLNNNKQLFVDIYKKGLFRDIGVKQSNENMKLVGAISYYLNQEESFKKNSTITCGFGIQGISDSNICMLFKEKGGDISLYYVDFAGNNFQDSIKILKNGDILFIYNRNNSCLMDMQYILNDPNMKQIKSISILGSLCGDTAEYYIYEGNFIVKMIDNNPSTDKYDYIYQMKSPVGIDFKEKNFDEIISQLNNSKPTKEIKLDSKTDLGKSIENFDYELNILKGNELKIIISGKEYLFK